jgi:hypothetical protein
LSAAAGRGLDQSSTVFIYDIIADKQGRHLRHPPAVDATIGPESHWTCPARSGRVMVSKETVRRVSIERCQSRIEAEPRPAVGTEDRVRLAHTDVDVRVVLRWGHADALEFPHPDADFGDAAIVPELQIAAAGHRPRPW